MFKRIHPALSLLLALGLVSAVVTLVGRYSVEAGFRAVELVLDLNQVRALAAGSGGSLVGTLTHLKEAGATGVAVTEESIGDLVDSGALALSVVRKGSERRSELLCRDPVLFNRIREQLEGVHPGFKAVQPEAPWVEFRLDAGSEGAEQPPFFLPGRFEENRLYPTGLDTEALTSVRAARLQVAARVWNPPTISQSSIRFIVGKLTDTQVDAVIFAGEEVLGFRELLPAASDALLASGLRYGSVEFGKQRGDDRMARAMGSRMLRVHSISPGEMARLSPAEAVERYARAASERNIRLFYIRFPAGAFVDGTRGAGRFVSSVGQATVRYGFGLAAAHELKPTWDPGPLRLARGCMGLGAGAAVALLLILLIPIPTHRHGVLGVGFGLLFSAAAASGVGIGIEATALTAAVVFPSLGPLLLPQPVGAFDRHEKLAARDRSAGILSASLEFSALVAITLCGGVLVAALLADVPYMLKTDSFAGVKLATTLPLIVVGISYLVGATGLYEHPAEEWKAISTRLRSILEDPVRVGTLVAGGAALVVLAIVVARSGNDSGLDVSSAELRFRALLDRVLFVRPRTKEFLLGHPAMLLALLLAAVPARRAVAFPLILVGLIGQVGMLNSFCHLHTPLKLTLIRTFNGAWTGILIGIAACLVWGILDPALRHERLRRR